LQLETLEVPLKMNTSQFNPAVAGAIAGIGAVVGVIAGAIKITVDWARGLDTLGDVMGGTNEEIAAMGYIAEKSGVGVDTFAQANVILEKGLLNVWGGLDKTGKALYQYGINVRNVNGTVKTQAQLTEDIAKKYKSLSTQQERVNFLTDVYGKSGAKLVDFFDTLNGEGGISAVEEKVKQLGLAIDPSRFEQFNRNLNELKLIGTGIAVSFTEQLMPSLESLLGWATDFLSAPIEQKLSMLADPLKLLFNFSDWFKKSTAEIDWGTVSENIASGIQSVDWAKGGLYVRQGVSNILQGIYTVVSEIDWGALGETTGNALAQLVAGLYGYPDWNALTLDFNNGFASLFGYTNNHAFADLKQDFSNGFVYIRQGWDGMLNGLKQAWENTSHDIENGVINLINRIIAAFNRIPNVDLPSIPNVGGSTSSSGNGGGSGGKRASGGAVIAGQTYDVAEFNKPEKFTPNSSGRIDPMSNTPVIDEDKIGKAVAKHLGMLLPSIIAIAQA
jgi:hypothetical protein